MTKILLALAAMVASAALAGCGGNGAPTAAATSPDARGQILAFAACMRDHGIDVPDPAPGTNRITINRGGSTDAQIQAANEACRKYRPEGTTSSPDPAEADRAIEFAQCLRQRGVNVADPQPGQPLNVQDQDRQKVQRAEQACQQLLGPEPTPRLSQAG